VANPFNKIIFLRYCSTAIFLGVSIIGFSLVGHLLTPGKLIAWSFNGGCFGIALEHYFLLKRSLIGKKSLVSSFVSNIITFGIFSFVAVFNLHSPLILILCFLIIITANSALNIYYEKYAKLPDHKQFAIFGLILIAPVTYFLTASILKFQFDYPSLFVPIDRLLGQVNGQIIFNEISPFLFAGGILLAFILNSYTVLKSGAKKSPANLSLISVSGLMGLILLVYLFLENI
jgi:hypothetical protein